MTKFYEKTGMYVDWDQLNRLPDIDLFIDIGVGPKGTPQLWEKYARKKIFCIDPLDEARDITNKLLEGSDFKFFQFALGSTPGRMFLNVEENKGRSSLLNVTEINQESKDIVKQEVDVVRLDELLKDDVSNEKIGMKIDTEGYELEVLKGATEMLKKTTFVLAEVRHNHTSFTGQYGFMAFNKFMADHDFYPSIVFTAKPFIIDICYEKNTRTI